MSREAIVVTAVTEVTVAIGATVVTMVEVKGRMGLSKSGVDVSLSIVLIFCSVNSQFGCPVCSLLLSGRMRIATDSTHNHSKRPPPSTMHQHSVELYCRYLNSIHVSIVSRSLHRPWRFTMEQQDL